MIVINPKKSLRIEIFLYLLFGSLIPALIILFIFAKQLQENQFTNLVDKVEEGMEVVLADLDSSVDSFKSSVALQSQENFLIDLLKAGKEAQDSLVELAAYLKEISNAKIVSIYKNDGSALVTTEKKTIKKLGDVFLKRIEKKKEEQIPVLVRFSIDKERGIRIDAYAPVVDAFEKHLQAVLQETIFIDKDFIGAVKVKTGLEVALFQQEEAFMYTSSVPPVLGSSIYSNLIETRNYTVQSALFINNIRYYTLLTPIKNEDGTVFGALGLLASGEIMEQNLKLIHKTFIIALLGIIAFSFGMSYWSANRVVKPVFDVIKALRRIAQGDINQRIKVKIKNEIRELANSFNKMADDLQKTTVSKSYVDNVINSMLNTLIVINTDETIQRVNPAILNLLGYEEKELIGKPISRIFPKEGSLFSRTELDKLNHKDFIKKEEKVYLSKDLKKIPVLFSSSVMYDAKGEIQGIVCVAQDISERKQAEEALHYKTKLIQLMQEIAVAANDASTVEEAMQICLDKVCASTGWPIGHIYLTSLTGILLPSTIWHLEPSKQFETFRKITGETTFKSGVGFPGRVLESGKPAWITDVTKDPNFPRAKLAENIGIKAGFAFPVLVDEKVTAVLEFFSEEAMEPDKSLLEALSSLAISLGRVTERKQSERALIQAKKDAEAANIAKSIFLANMSHEIRTPLNGVLGFAQILQRDKNINPKQHGFVAKIIECGNHLLGIINDVLDISKIEAGKKELNLVDFDLNELFCGLSSIFEIKCKEKGLSWSKEGIGNDPIFVYGDVGKLRQVIFNLAGNAVKFTVKGCVSLRIHPEPDNKYIFEIRDTGPGIIPEDMLHLYDPFYQGKEGIRKGGTGLGLVISKRLIDFMGGRLYLESEVDKGSRFYFSLTLPPASGLVTPRENRDKRIIRLAEGYHVKALIVDDVKANREVLIQILRDVGVEVSVAKNGYEVIEKTRKTPPDIIFMDVRMPDIDGLEASRRIRASGNKKVKIIILTASVYGNIKKHCMDAGCEGLIMKPFRIEMIYRSLREHLHIEYETLENSQKDKYPGLKIDLSAFAIPEHIYKCLLNAAKLYETSEIKRCLKEVEALNDQNNILVEYMMKLAKDLNMDKLISALEEIKKI